MILYYNINKISEANENKLKQLLDNITQEQEGRERGRIAGKEEGREESKDKGRHEGKLAATKKLFSIVMSFEQVSDVTEILVGALIVLVPINLLIANP